MKNSKDKLLKNSYFKNLIPSITAMWVYSIYTIIDGIFVGRGVGPTALAGVNLSMPFINLIFASSIFFATGTSTLVSIHLGKKELKKAREIFSYNLLIMLVFSFILLIFTLLFMDNIAYFLGATENTFTIVKDYLSIIVLFNVFFIVSYCLEVLTKADGFPHLAIIGVIISAITNIILDYIFVIELGLGVKGAAIATGISQIASFLFFASHFLRKRSTLKLVKFKPTFNILKRIIKIGFPDGVTELTSGIVILIFNQCILMVIGENGLITYSIICYVSNLVLMTMIGSTQGLQPLCSYYYGQKDLNSIKYLLKLSFKTITLISLTIFILCLIFAPQIVSLFINHGSAKLIKDSILAFRVYSISFLLLGFNILCSGFCVSIEKPLFATIISLSRGFVFIIVSLIVSILLFGGNGIWISPLICEIGCLFISFLCTKKSFNSILKSTKDYNMNKEIII